MKNLIFTLSLLTSCIISAHSQNINGILLNNIKAEYIDMICRPSIYDDYTYIRLDYGQKYNMKEEWVLKDKHGEKMKFNTKVDALNFMSKYGYYLTEVYTHDEDDNDVHYILRKKKDLKNTDN